MKKKKILLRFTLDCARQKSFELMADGVVMADGYV